jgi:hypothetical protein
MLGSFQAEQPAADEGTWHLGILRYWEESSFNDDTGTYPKDKS